MRADEIAQAWRLYDEAMGYDAGDVRLPWSNGDSAEDGDPQSATDPPRYDDVEDGLPIPERG